MSSEEEIQSRTTLPDFYLRLLCRLIFLTFFFAFSDTLFQYNQIIGSKGVSPISQFIENAQKQFGDIAIIKFPSIFWISANDTFIFCALLFGVFISLIGALGKWSHLSLFLCCILWLSLINTGGDFFLYIWDTFLLESGWLCLFLLMLPINKYPSLKFFALYFLCFRLWFSMGIVTVIFPHSIGLNGDFIRYFFQNQPMPTPVSFYLYHLPSYFHSLIAIILFVVEVLVPFFVFIPRLRRLAFWIFAIFSILIMLCGNFAWFNLLSIFVAVPLLSHSKTGKVLYEKTDKWVNQLKDSTGVIIFKVGFYLLLYQLMLQAVFVIMLFSPLGNRYLNFLNYFNNNKEFLELQKKYSSLRLAALPFDINSSLKFSNPYGVFKGIPVKRWQTNFSYNTTSESNELIKYTFKTQGQGPVFFAPHFPRLEQQLFYESQQGSFYRHYTSFENRLDNYCWTKNLYSYFKHKATTIQQTSSTKNNDSLVLEISNEGFTSWEEYVNTGKMWKSEPVSAIVMNNASLCPLIPDSCYLVLRKHEP